jgi:hypothetical protein
MTAGWISGRRRQLRSVLPPQPQRTARPPPPRCIAMAPGARQQRVAKFDPGVPEHVTARELDSSDRRAVAAQDPPSEPIVVPVPDCRAEHTPGLALLPPARLPRAAIRVNRPATRATPMANSATATRTPIKPAFGRRQPAPRTFVKTPCGPRGQPGQRPRRRPPQPARASHQ